MGFKLTRKFAEIFLKLHFGNAVYVMSFRAPFFDRPELHNNGRWTGKHQPWVFGK